MICIENSFYKYIKCLITSANRIAYYGNIFLFNKTFYFLDIKHSFVSMLAEHR